MPKSPAETSIDLQAKFDYYFLGLIFAVLGLSIQTAKFGSFVAADCFELVGWLLLFVAGVVGIFRGEWIPVVYRIEAKIKGVQNDIAHVQAGLQQGVQVEISFVENGQEAVLRGQAAIDKYRSTLPILETQSKDAEDSIIKRYWWMKWAFMVGVACLFVGRAYEPFLGLLPALKWCFSSASV